ncbi:MAG: hypothetical protein K2N74_05075 [Clostridiales bacterium]|nr:hypothetical protein [Clostridiales bacterium]
MLNDQLNRRESEVMGAVFALSDGKERFLVSPYEILSMLPPKADYDEEKLECILRALELDGYFDLIASERKGERVFVVHMREAGLGYRRSDVRRKRSFLFRIAVTVLCGILSFLVGVILKKIFS